jgi:AcrR family transcriptional regulator
VLNVFKKSKHHQSNVPLSDVLKERPGKGEETSEQILNTAIRLFRKNGFDQTTMRDVAQEAGVAPGLAYHYFPGKEALVMAYYERVQTEHRMLVRRKLEERKPLRERLSMLMQTKLDILKDDRKLLGALFRYAGNPEHSLSFLGRGTASIRADCMALFAEALEDEPLPEDLRLLLPTVFWAMHMGTLLYFLYDSSPGQEQTRRLADGAVGLAVKMLKSARLPVMRPVRAGVMKLLREAGLVPEL